MLSLRDIRKKRRVLGVLHKHTGDTREMKGMILVSDGHYRNEALRIAKCSAIILIGVLAMTIPPANPAQPLSHLAILFTFGLFVIAFLISLASIADRRQRVRIERLFREAYVGEAEK